MPIERSPLRCLLPLLAVLSTAPVARGEERNPAVAEVLFREGQQLLAGGKTAEACEKLGESERLDPQTGTLLNLALCHEKQGRMATAWSELGEVVTQTVRKEERDRERFARSHVADVERRLSRVVLEVAREVARIEVDGQGLGQAAWSVSLPLDPGEHSITFAAPGMKARTLTITVPSGPATLRVVSPPLDTEAPIAPPLAGPAAASLPVVPGAGDNLPPREARDSTKRTLALVIGGTGVMGIATGAVLGLLAISKKRDVDAHCAGRECDDIGLAAQNTARTDATVSSIAFAAGVVGLGAGTYLLVTSGGRAKRAIGVSPVATNGGAMLRIGGEW